jgi:hypothetical protein
VIPLKRFHFFCGNLEAQLSSTSWTVLNELSPVLVLQCHPRHAALLVCNAQRRSPPLQHFPPGSTMKVAPKHTQNPVVHNFSNKESFYYIYIYNVYVYVYICINVTYIYIMYMYIYIYEFPVISCIFLCWKQVWIMETFGKYWLW